MIPKSKKTSLGFVAILIFTLVLAPIANAGFWDPIIDLLSPQQGETIEDITPNLGLTVMYPLDGGTGTSTTPSAGQVLVGQSNGTYGPQATSTLGFGGGLTSLNGLTTSTQTFASSTATSTFDIVSSGFTHTFTLPSNLGFFSNDTGLITDVASDTTPVLGGNLDAGGFDITNASSITATSSITGKFFANTPEATQTVTAAATALTGTNGVLRFDSDADYVLTATPSIADGEDGQVLYLYNTGSFTVELQDEDDLTGSNVLLDGASGSMMPAELTTFVFNASESAWLIQSHPNGGVGNVGFVGKVNEAAGISKGEVVYFSGATGNFGQVSLADNTDFDKSDAIGVAFETKTDGQQIIVTQLGEITQQDTSGMIAGDIIYLDTAGGFTNIHPGATNAVVRIGHAIKINASTGRIHVTLKSLITIDTFDGIMRVQVVNQSTGTSSAATMTYINDAGHRGTIGLAGSNNTVFGSEGFAVFAEGYGNFEFVNNGNKPFLWETEVADTHAAGAATEKMRLTAAGELLIGTSTANGFLTVGATSTQQFLVSNLGVVTDGVWEGTTIAVNQGGTGATSLNDLITLGTHTTGNYVADITAGTSIDVSGGGSETATITVDFDSTETATTTWGGRVLISFGHLIPPQQIQRWHFRRG